MGKEKTLTIFLVVVIQLVNFVMKIIRELFFYKHYFDDFIKPLSDKLKNKIDEILFMFIIVNQVPKKFFNKIEGTKGLLEIRIEFEGNIYRIFCCFDKGNIMVLFNGFQKKSQKTPRHEIEKARKIMKEYFSEKKA